MKKYIFGCIAAIGLMGAGCTQFEDYTPVDMGEGPAIEVVMNIPENTLGQFTVDITPAEGTVYYSYLLTSEPIENIKGSQLLQQKYKEQGSLLLRADETPSVSLEQKDQNMQTEYHVYAVAADKRGLCGKVAQVSLFLPDTEVPNLVNIPESPRWCYTAAHVGRTIELEYNEPVFRGEGALTYSISKEEGGRPGATYAEGAIEDIVINDKKVTVTLPENALNKEENAFVFLDFAEGVFVDAAGNKTVALKGGYIGGGIAAPWWKYVVDKEAPYLVNIPDNYEYKAYNQGYSTIIEFNELVFRGEGAITYSIADESALPPYYAMGTVHNVEIDGTKVTITLDEDVQFDENESMSFVFLDFEAGAFTDESGNLSAAMKGGVDAATGDVCSPWWMYDPTAPDPNAGLNLEISEDGLGMYLLTYTSLLDGSSYQESTYFIDAAKFGITSCQYAVMYIGAFLNETAANEGDWGLLPAKVEDNTFYIQHMGIVGEATNPEDGNVYYVGVIALVLDANGDLEGVYSEDYVPFVPYSEDPRALLVADENILLAYAWIDKSSYATVDWIDIMYGWTFIPESMLSQTNALSGFKSATVESLKSKRANDFIKNNIEIPYMRGIYLKK